MNWHQKPSKCRALKDPTSVAAHCSTDRYGESLYSYGEIMTGRLGQKLSKAPDYLNDLFTSYSPPYCLDESKKR